MNVYGHADAFLPAVASERKTRENARWRAEHGAPTTIHRHPYGEDCADECEYVPAADERKP